MVSAKDIGAITSALLSNSMGKSLKEMGFALMISLTRPSPL